MQSSFGITQRVATITQRVALGALFAVVSVYGQSKGMPPRSTPGDYQAHAQTGGFTIGAEFAGHSIPDPQSVLSTEDFVVVEVGVFGPPDGHLNLSYENFSLKINGKKTPLSGAGEVTRTFKSLKDPEFGACGESGEAKTKTNIGGGGGGAADNGGLPPVVHIPIGIGTRDAAEGTEDLRCLKGTVRRRRPGSFSSNTTGKRTRSSLFIAVQRGKPR